MLAQKRYWLLSVLFLFIFAARLFFMISTDQGSWIELTNWAAIAYMAWAIGILYPQFKEKDERMTAIRQKGLFYTVFVIFTLLIVLLLLTQFHVLTLTALELIRLLISIFIVTIWTSWLILSKRI